MPPIILQRWAVCSLWLCWCLEKQPVIPLLLALFITLSTAGGPSEAFQLGFRSAPQVGGPTVVTAVSCSGAVLCS